MALLIQVIDAVGKDVEGTAKVEFVIRRKDGTATTLTGDAAPQFTVPFDATWQSAEMTIAHADYLRQLVRFRTEGTALQWSDPSSEMSDQGGNLTLRVPLGRVRFAPGQTPPFGKPTGDEKGIYLDQSPDRAQSYVGLEVMRAPVAKMRVLKDLVIDPSLPPTCVLNPHDDDGWQRFNWEETQEANPSRGVFAWLEYGSPASNPQLPRFLIAVWIPSREDGLKDGKVDVLTFYSPSTANELYPVSQYPFRDQYPYSAYGRTVTDVETKEKHDAKVQPYVLLGLKYLFSPSHIVGMCVASGKLPVVVMPIFPRAQESAGQKHMWQPFNSQAGLWRLFIEVTQFLEREGYAGSSFDRNRFNGAIAPTAGDPTPPAPAFGSANRKRLGIRDVIVSGYSSASTAFDSLLRTPAISGSTANYPPKLFGADPAEFDKRWKELWALDLSLLKKTTLTDRTQFQNTLRQWLMRDDRRLRIYHSDWTLEHLAPEAFYPILRKQLTAPPRVVRDLSVAGRWAADWREPAGHWSAIFFGGAELRALYVDPVLPSFPISSPDGSKGDPPSAIHGFTMSLGFAHAAFLR